VNGDKAWAANVSATHYAFKNREKTRFFKAYLVIAAAPTGALRARSSLARSVKRYNSNEDVVEFAKTVGRDKLPAGPELERRLQAKNDDEIKLVDVDGWDNTLEGLVAA